MSTWFVHASLSKYGLLASEFGLWASIFDFRALYLVQGVVSSEYLLADKPIVQTDDCRLIRAEPTFFGSAHRLGPSAKKPTTNVVGTTIVQAAGNQRLADLLLTSCSSRMKPTGIVHSAETGMKVSASHLLHGY